MIRRYTRRRTPLLAGPAETPISDLNTTPLIDVMLVLLIMFIVTIPLATHGIKMDLPTGPGGVEPETHRLDLDRTGRLAFDGVPVAPAALAPRLRAMLADNRDNVLHFRTDGDARYEDFDRTLAIVKGAGVERIGFLGNEAFVAALER
ncbi:biopolymer transporter ExbD [Sphingomonas parva]|uniref:Biopolymer transporter ExbD n=1 Tax=Sphingomonas parva TaxID=2555898 RepID=A0A4Y8ZPH0_9SPHN|nr:biopolymer transporter ExbD [Sphingomonas parva]TFI57910.1 biopolymer transporter ExbD [Sphingomonas parva]